MKLTAARSMDEYRNGTNVYFYDATPNLNKFATQGSEFEKVTISKNPQLLVKLAPTDIALNETTVTIDGYLFDMPDTHRASTGSLTAPAAQVTAENTEAYTLKPTWNKTAHADFGESFRRRLLRNRI